VILLDTSGLLSAIDAAQPHHARAAAALAGSPGPLVLSPFVLAELDYLVGRRVGARAQRTLLDQVGVGAYQLAPMTETDVSRASEVIDRYADLAIGIADASIVVLAERLDCLDVLTLDERHFRTLAGPGDRPFRLLPADG
jgi:predicted nucleic acid-binding protein